MIKYKYFFYIIIFLHLLSCGLPSYSVVEPPVVGDSDTVSVSFSAPVDDSNITGYEIYYKIYPSTENDAIQADKELFDDESSSYVYEFGDSKPKKLGFFRLQYGDTRQVILPLISNDISQSVYLEAGEVLEVNFSQEQLIVDGTPIGEPSRLIDDIAESFSSDEIDGDKDANGVESGMAYSISFVAYSYVSAIIDSTYENSIPVFLGTIDNTN
jgi:hypothetical protein